MISPAVLDSPVVGAPLGSSLVSRWLPPRCRHFCGPHSSPALLNLRTLSVPVSVTRWRVACSSPPGRLALLPGRVTDRGPCGSLRVPGQTVVAQRAGPSSTRPLFSLGDWPVDAADPPWALPKQLLGLWCDRVHSGVFVFGSATRCVCKLRRDAHAVKGPGRRCETGRWGTRTCSTRLAKRVWRGRAGCDACRRVGSVGSWSWPDSRLPRRRHSGAH